MGKKRKPELDLDAERTMYSSFVTAANAVSQLYTQGVQQHRRVAAAASRATLEKVLNFVLRESSGAEQLPKAALIQFLQHEYENVDTQENAAPQHQLLLPFGVPGFAAGQEDGQDSQQPKQPNRQSSGGNMVASPALRGRSGSLEDQQSHHHHQQQQMHQQQQQQVQMQQQQLQHQQQHPHISGASSLQMQSALMHGMVNGPCCAGQTPGMQYSMFMSPGPGMH